MSGAHAVPVATSIDLGHGANTSTSTEVQVADCGCCRRGDETFITQLQQHGATLRIHSRSGNMLKVRMSEFMAVGMKPSLENE